jgi:hypothetical protein
MTPAELITIVETRIGRAGDTTLDADILYALNTVQRKAINLINFQELMILDKTSISLTASTASYSLPTDFVKMITIWNNDLYEKELQRIHPRDYKNFLSDLDDTGDMNYYSIMGSSGTSKLIYFFSQLASRLTGTITAVADYSGTVAGTVLVTDAAHGLSTGNTITIAGTTNYNGTFTVTVVSVDTFYITETFVASETGTWTKLHYVPFVYMKSLSDLTASGSANILTTFYPDLYIEGATYYMYRDVIYRDQPEKIVFRKAEYKDEIEHVLRAQRQADEISQISPKRLLPSTGKLYNVQTTGYSS